MKKYLIFLLLTLPICLLAQNKATLTGKVTSATDKEPLIGVTVVEKGTTNGTVTDLDGNYSLPNVSDNSTIVFSMIGLATQEIKKNQSNVINVIMKDDTKLLDDEYCVVKPMMLGDLGIPHKNKNGMIVMDSRNRDDVKVNIRKLKDLKESGYFYKPRPRKIINR